MRSCHNVGSILRTAEGLGADKVYLTGYTPYPISRTDPRLPHLACKIHDRIKKTALGAEELVPWEHQPEITKLIAKLRQEGHTIIALEQSAESVPLPEFVPPDKTVLILGREVEGLESEVLKLTDAAIEIPMLGHKESFNVVQAAAMALYHCRYTE